MTTSEDIRAWFTGRLPQDWTAPGPASVEVDREEVVVVLTLAIPSSAGDQGTGNQGATDDAASAAAAQQQAGSVSRFREETREARIAVAREAEHRFGRKVAWGVRVGPEGDVQLFTHLAVPVMTRLRQPERLVLDTLVEAGVARSRAHALAWCVKLVNRNSDTWLGELREAMGKVDEVRRSGPAA